MQPLNFDEVLDRLTRQDSRYDREAYVFMRDGLEHTQISLAVNEKSEPGHVTGQELLAGLREFALAQFGPMAKTVLNEWGIHSCQDFGEIVFILIEQGLLSKTDTDHRDDFKAGFDFEEAFCFPFRPRARDAMASLPPTSAGQP